jgi:hypothetical protein
MRTLVSIALAVVLLIPGVAWCCTCAPPPPPRESLRDASAVFLGHCISGRWRAAAHEAEFTFDVRRAWKGVRGQNHVTLTTEASPATCGYDFHIGDTYIVYCSRMGTKLYVSRCSRTCPFPSPDYVGEDKALDAAIQSK